MRKIEVLAKRLLEAGTLVEELTYAKDTTEQALKHAIDLAEVARKEYMIELGKMRA